MNSHSRTQECSLKAKHCYVLCTACGRAWQRCTPTSGCYLLTRQPQSPPQSNLILTSALCLWSELPLSLHLQILCPVRVGIGPDMGQTCMKMDENDYVLHCVTNLITDLGSDLYKVEQLECTCFCSPDHSPCIIRRDLWPKADGYDLTDAAEDGTDPIPPHTFLLHLINSLYTLALGVYDGMTYCSFEHYPAYPPEQLLTIAGFQTMSSEMPCHVSLHAMQVCLLHASSHS